MLPRGDDGLDDAALIVESPPSSAPARSTPPHAAADPMFLPEQTLSPSSSSSSSSNSRPSSASASVSALPTPTPTPPPSSAFGTYPAGAQHELAEYYDMHLNEANDPFEDPDWAARRLRAHGKRRQRDTALPIARRGGCVNLDNGQLSCQPTAGQQVIQNSWFEFQWSTRNPLFNQVDDVLIYLFNGDSGDQVGFWTKNKLQGSIQVQANDTFWGAAGPQIQSGANQTFPFYFVIIPSTATVHNGETSEPTFTGIQTALPNSVIASISSQSKLSTQSVPSVSSVSTASLASVASVSASISSQSLRSVISTATSNPTTTSPNGGSSGGSIQNGSSGNGFPSWAIALITILAFFLLLAVLLGTYLIMRRIRRQREEEERRNSIGSASPMIVGGAHDQKSQAGDHHTGGAEAAGAAGALGGGAGGGPGSERGMHSGDEKAALLGAGAGAGAGGLARAHNPNLSHLSHHTGLGGGIGNDGASMMSGSDTTGGGGGSGLLSGADAAIVADAFRQAMRKPDFTGRPVEEDESPDQPADDSTDSGHARRLERERELMSEELAREGRDIRSVGSARDVRVQGSTTSTRES